MKHEVFRSLPCPTNVTSLVGKGMRKRLAGVQSIVLSHPCIVCSIRRDAAAATSSSNDEPRGYPQSLEDRVGSWTACIHVLSS